MSEESIIEVSVDIDAPLEMVWQSFIHPDAITRWNYAQSDWCCPKASNDFRVGGAFSYRMEACDKSVGFDFGGTYTEIQDKKMIRYILDDGRNVSIQFVGESHHCIVIEDFQAESTYSITQQKEGWQAILNNFKSYVESQK